MTRKDLGFRMGTGAFAFVVIAIVCGIGIVLTKQSMLSIEKFGLKFWRTDIWDPVSGEFGALPFIWGTLYSSVLALVIATPIAIGIAVFISELCPARLRQPLVFLTELLAAIPSIVYGLWGIFVLVPAVRAARRGERFISSILSVDTDELVMDHPQRILNRCNNEDGIRAAIDDRR